MKGDLELLYVVVLFGCYVRAEESEYLFQYLGTRDIRLHFVNFRANKLKDFDTISYVFVIFYTTIINFTLKNKCIIMAYAFYDTKQVLASFSYYYRYIICVV
jgi:hypothetical protein